MARSSVYVVSSELMERKGRRNVPLRVLSVVFSLSSASWSVIAEASVASATGRRDWRYMFDVGSTKKLSLRSSNRRAVSLYLKERRGGYNMHFPYHPTPLARQHNKMPERGFQVPIFVSSHGRNGHRQTGSLRERSEARI